MKKIYFASDVHLGAPALKQTKEREMLFVNWLQTIRHDASMIFLLGDIFDFWFEYKKVAPRGFVRMLGTLADICDSGTPVHFFTGNHDIWLFDYLPEETGIIIHRKPMMTEFDGKKFFIAHGDDLGKKDIGYQLLQGFFKNRLAQWAFAKIHPDLAFRLAHKWSKNSRLSKGVKALGFLGEEKEEQILFARSVLAKEHFDYFVFGHRHLLIDFDLNEQSKLIVLGEWFKEYSYGVWNGVQFHIENIDNEILEKFRININL